MEYTLIRSDRKTLAVYITDEATVVARAPLKMPKADIDRFIELKKAWISAHLAAKTAQNGRKTSFCLKYSDKILFRGAEYPIIARNGNKAGFDGESFYMPDGYDGDKIRDTAVQVYKLLAQKLLAAKTAEYAKKMSVKPASVRINSAKTRWGSCSGKNGINFSWRLVLASDDVIDYVVVHELAHTFQHNHSKEFWAVVASYAPEYKQHRAWLRKNGSLLRPQA